MEIGPTNIRAQALGQRSVRTFFGRFILKAKLMFSGSWVETPMRDARAGMRRTCAQTVLESGASDG
jgi:hypothetical protein